MHCADQTISGYGLDLSMTTILYKVSFHLGSAQGSAVPDDLRGVRVGLAACVCVCVCGGGGVRGRGG